MRVEPDQIDQLERAHRVVEAEVDRGVDVLPRGEPVFEHPDRAVQVRDQQRVHDEPGAVARLDGRLPERHAVGASELDRVLRRGDGPHELDEPHHRDGVEEVHPEDLVGPGGRGAEVGDRDRRRVAREDHVGLGDLVEPAEHPDLRVVILGRGLDHEIDVRELVHVGRPGDAPEQRVALGGLQPAAFDRAQGGGLDPVAPRSTSSSLASRKTTVCPARATVSAMPEPIRPHPMIPTVRTSSARIAPPCQEASVQSAESPDGEGRSDVREGPRLRGLPAFGAAAAGLVLGHALAYLIAIPIRTSARSPFNEPAMPICPRSIRRR